MQRVGYIFIGLGALTLAIWLGIEFLCDPGVSMFVKVAVSAVVLGTLILLGAVLRDRIRASKNDRFKGVER
ncbi:MAG TPA: hypothetical protein ENL12_02540 [Dehalococcoidia bacterium]|nr:hypothetical protein [Dehalococcoidia bacterium]